MEREERNIPRQDAPEGEAPASAAMPVIWQGTTPILCLAGRGPLDEAASTMLAQLLRKHGLGARVEAHSAVLRGNLDQLDLSGVAMVCVSYLEMAGSPTHLRYLLRRLRQKLPGVPFLGGLWPADDAFLKDDGLRQTLGAEYYVTSLHDAVTSCLDAAHRTTADGVPDRAPAHQPA